MTAANQMAAETTERRTRRSVRPDRPSLILFSLAGFMAVLAVMAIQVHRTASTHTSRAVLVRRIYTTTVIETVAAGRGPQRTATVPSSAPPTPLPTPPAPTTRTS